MAADEAADSIAESADVGAADELLDAAGAVGEPLSDVTGTSITYLIRPVSLRRFDGPSVMHYTLVHTLTYLRSGFNLFTHGLGRTTTNTEESATGLTVIHSITAMVAQRLMRRIAIRDIYN